MDIRKGKGRYKAAMIKEGRRNTESAAQCIKNAINTGNINGKQLKRYMPAGIIVVIIIAIKLLTAKDIQHNAVSSIERPEPGEAAKNIAIEVYDETGKLQTTVAASVKPRKMSEEETNACFDNAYKELLDSMLKDNNSTEAVTTDLYMPDSLMNGLIRVSLYPSDYTVIDYDGTVYNEMLKKGDTKEVSINYVLQYDEYDRQGTIELIVKPLEDMQQEELCEDAENKVIQKAVDSSVNVNTDDKKASLPEHIGEKKVYYRYVKEKVPYVTYIMILAAAVALVLYRNKLNDRKQQEKRVKELQYDYSELISKLTLLLGAGMTIRRAWEKLVEDYIKKKENGAAIKQVYEEMYITDCNIKAGISEYKAYEEFGHRCNTREYLKLASLLQTNLKRGTNRLRELLYQESYDAFEQRKNIARQKGEEATTKLLIPMVMMLLVVMVIVMIPAVMSFYLT